MREEEVSLKLMAMLTDSGAVVTGADREAIRICAASGCDAYEAMHKTAIRLTERVSRLSPDMLDVLARVREMARNPCHELREATR